MIFPKKEILYAPMLGTLGGGSLRSFGRGTGGGVFGGIESVSQTYLNQSYNGVQFWQSDSPPSYTGATFMDLNVISGGQFYCALVGAGGGGGYNDNGEGGTGGFGIAKVTVPATSTVMRIYIGGAGRFVNNGNAAAGGAYFGGNGGDPFWNYAASASGGGFTGLFSIQSLTQSYAILAVGSGGGGGAGGGRGGHGGGLGRVGLGGHLSSTSVHYGGGGQLTSGGTAANDNARTIASGGAGATAGSYGTGGNGADSDYDAGSGGGAGHFGGGGGASGGGYDGGAGGGGSGYVHPTYATTDIDGTVYNSDGGTSNTGVGNITPLSSDLNAWIRTVSGAGSWSPNSNNYGRGGANQGTGKAGFALVWNVA